MIWIIYLIGMVDDIKCLLIIPSILLMVVLLVSFLFMRLHSYGEDDNKKINQYTIKTFLLLIPILIGMLVPSSKTISTMYLIPKITANEQVQQIPDKVLKVMNGKLDEWIDDLTKERKDK